MTNSLYTSILQSNQSNKKKFAVLIDPDNTDRISLDQLIELTVKQDVDYFFVGGSLIVRDNLDDCLNTIKKDCNIPVILFPGSSYQINDKADAIFFLSLISGRNPELLIGQQVAAAPLLKKSSLEVIPTGYMIIDGQAPTTVSYISNTNPIPTDKTDIAVCTAMAGEMLGLKMIYMDAGSGAKKPISEEMIREVRNNISIPMVVGGGIASSEKAYLNCKAGADIIVIGNAIEKDPTLIGEISEAIHSVETIQ
ncbi:MAG: geranylgeranylglyceryl/heptaprenylglyceryl phosphate synthase [Bacteroidetes bacterium]|nr:geranylgeranylglyceryl/heptaprenylglyceryl phosphate synthase [Bacteroidota bacterium]